VGNRVNGCMSLILLHVYFPRRNTLNRLNACVFFISSSYQCDALGGPVAVAERSKA
jgi:hypothetical protein